MNNNKDIQHKIKQILSNERLSKSDYQTLEEFVHYLESNDELQQYYDERWENSQHANRGTLSFSKIKDEIKVNDKSVKYLKQYQTSLQSNIVAACTILMLCVGAWYYAQITKGKFEGSLISKVEPLKKPVEEEVVLLRNNKNYVLSSNLVEINSDNSVIKGQGNTLSVETKDIQTQKQEWSTLKVPNGKSYTIELCDGTKVWLNACSELTFPDVFIGNNREVKLKGEAFFSVHSDKAHPFWVNTERSKVRVTGTQFNVNSYPNENNTVTLVEGVVGVLVDNQEFTIKPGQQLVQFKNQACEIKNVNTSLYTCWRDGVYEFRDLSLKDITTRLERWYNVEFYFENAAIEQEHFSGMVKKERDINYFIKVLEKTTNYKFTLLGSKIVIKES